MLDSVKSLVLNYSYQPLQFCSAKRAIIMILSGRAEAVESDGYVIRSPNAEFRLPAVIRVLNLVRVKRSNRIAFSKKNILRRDSFMCQYCGDTRQPLTLDHVFPKSKGGEAKWDNVVIACKPCNLKKGNRTVVEANMRLMKQPKQPQFQYFHFAVPTGPKSHLDIWRKYLPEKIIKGAYYS
ncbi:MAG: HNH endonuclease [Candidatus Nitrohelix vancouverensis]|uniref:HNH endonuclease n=1 Tax=Candidatus Nitrohelix vancouverensis TaxID=2705534 RepID=A0A7T0C3S2_9BACT|nr:MAG: HNH endonuclease [Candidatus Nitrohelix vancouverensis]